ncbi:hypothetical protein GOODEAATRI_000066 [Goodea atripinnis]|uniref:GAT domain-containing protein n=1 Tax=Goodea atripinnis TaxID=208336 RepID=A0ABV0PJI1_9TELE
MAAPPDTESLESRITLLEVGKFRFLNELIKVVSPKDQRRAEKVSKRVNAIQEVKESVTLLTQLLQDYDSTTTNQSNADLIQVK